MKRVNALLNRSVPSKQEPSPTTSETRSFVHKPLDETKASLRLITVSSELSADGSIQCYISHSTLDRASYVCLSYRWGNPGDLVRIHINGAPFHIRRNLYEFLDMVRRMPMTFYWIDAICIDQVNPTERSHQVAQMGRIFSGAFLVYIWLGSIPLMTPWLQFLRSERSYQGLDTSSWSVLVEAYQLLNTHIYNNEYWSRAWVAQEVLLARSVIVLLCRESFKFPELVKSIPKFNSVDLGNFRNCDLARFADLMSNFGQCRSRILIHLLERFRNSQCENPRDRIYSLLSLSTDSQLPRVNYSHSHEDVAYEVLKRSDEPLCICSALLVGQTLGLTPEQDRHRSSYQRRDPFTVVEFNIQDLWFARHAMLASDVIQSWAHYKLMGTNMFGHDYVFSGFCPVFEALMDRLQARAISMNTTASSASDDSASLPTNTPLLLKRMDSEHQLAMLSGFGSALTVYAPNGSPNISTVQVALELLVELVPQTHELCSRVAQRNHRTKNENSDDVLSSSDKDGQIHRMESIQRRGTEWNNGDFQRVDSAQTTKTQDVEGPVSRLRVWRAQ